MAEIDKTLRHLGPSPGPNHTNARIYRRDEQWPPPINSAPLLPTDPRARDEILDARAASKLNDVMELLERLIERADRMDKRMDALGAGKMPELGEPTSESPYGSGCARQLAADTGRKH